MLTIIIGIPILFNTHKSWKIKNKAIVIGFCLAFDAVMLYNNFITHLK